MLSCSSCSGLIPSTCSICPNCRTEVSSTANSATTSIDALSKKALRGALVACTSMTLMACYGAPALIGGDVCEEVEGQSTSAPVELDLEVMAPTVYGEDSCLDSENDRRAVRVSIATAGQYTIAVSAEFPAKLALFRPDLDGGCEALEACVLPDGAGGMGGAGPESQESTLTTTLDVGEYVVVVEADSDGSSFDPHFQLSITRSN